MMELRLTLDGGTTGRGSMWTLRENFYLNNHGSPLVAAYAPGGKTNLAKQPHFGATAGVMVMIGNMPFDQVPSRLERVTVELDLVEITEWETLKFEAGPEPQIFHCGPFELKVAAGVNRLWVDAGAFREFAAEHKAYRARMPLEFLKPSYATTALKLVDAQGSTPSGFSSSSRNSGSPNWANEVESVDYSTWRKGPVTTPISYPITLTLKMPKRFKTEKVRFVFDQIELDPPATK
jgi:hypothetical protein